MRNLSAVGLAITVCIGISCEKELPGDIEKENIGIPLIAREMYGAHLGWKYTYTAANLPHEIRTNWSYAVYFYNDDHQVTGYDFYEDPGIYSSYAPLAESAMHRTEWVSPLNTRKSLHASYKYINDKPVRKTVLRFMDGLTYSSAFETDSIGRISRQSYESGYVDYTYDHSGNVLESRQYHYVDGAPVLITLQEYEYDDHPNPFKVFRRLLIPGRFSNENNVIRLTRTLYTDGTDVQVESSFYEYNDEGYPVKKDDMINYEYW
jgi:hypothetical protein